MADVAIIEMPISLGATLPPVTAGRSIIYLDPTTGQISKRDDAGIVVSLESGFSGDYNDLVNLPPLGSAAAQDATAFATAAQGGVADTALQPGDDVSALVNDAGYLTTETTTILAAIPNGLRYTDETGAATDIDLSSYLDDTNLARLVGGTVDGAGLGTFSRDDGTTFSVDFSGLIDPNQDSDAVTNASTVTGASVSDALEFLDVDKLSFVAPQDDVVTELPAAIPANANKVYSLMVNPAGDGYQYFEEYEAFVQDDQARGTTGEAFTSYLSGSFNIPVTGDYIATVSYIWTYSLSTRDFKSQFALDGAPLQFPQRVEHSDNGGNIGGLVIRDTVDPAIILDPASNQALASNTTAVIEGLSAGVHTLSLDIAADVTGNVAAVYGATIHIRRMRTL